MGLARPVDTLVRMADLRALPRGMAGVAALTRLEGRQYSVADPAEPHGLFVRLSTHFSLAHRRSDVPAADLRTWPCFFRHLATACAARADHFPPYVCITLR